MRTGARLVLGACALLAALAIAGGACWPRHPADDGVSRDAANRSRTAQADAELAARETAEGPLAPSEPATPSAGATQRQLVAGPGVLRGRLLAPAGMPLPTPTRLIAVVDDTDWQSFLHQRNGGGARVTLQVDADGTFALAWPTDAERMTLYADAPTLADVALAVIYRTAPGEFAFARVARVPGEWIAPTLAPQQRVAYVDGVLELSTYGAIVIVGTLGESLPPGSFAPFNQRANVLVRAWLSESVEWKWDAVAGGEFRFEHVPLDGDITLGVEGPYHWLDPIVIREPQPGETRDVGAVGERRYALHGRLVDAHGAPVAAAGVRAYETGPGGFPQHLDWQKTDAEGRFALGRIPARTIAIRAGRVHPEYGASGVLTTFEIAPGAVLSGDELVLQLQPSARLAGLVLRPDGSPARGARLRIPRSAAVTDPWEGTSRLDATADEHGRFSFFEVPARALDLSVWEDRQLEHEPNLVARLVVAPDTDNLVVRLAPIAPLRGQLVSADGAPWNEKWFLETSSDNVDWWGGTFESSAFEHERLWPGQWWIQARTESGLRSPTIEIDVPGDLAREHVLVLQP
jgi:hypothetical protein